VLILATPEVWSEGAELVSVAAFPYHLPSTSAQTRASTIVSAAKLDTERINPFPPQRVKILCINFESSEDMRSSGGGRAYLPEDLYGASAPRVFAGSEQPGSERQRGKAAPAASSALSATGFLESMRPDAATSLLESGQNGAKDW